MIVAQARNIVASLRHFRKDTQTLNGVCPACPRPQNCGWGRACSGEKVREHSAVQLKVCEFKV